MNVKHYELVAEAKEFLHKNYDMELTIPIHFNTRMKRVLGRFMFNSKLGKNVPQKIEMSTDFMLHHPRERIIDVLRHELVHYVLCVKEKPFDDGHHVFEGELKKHGIKSTHSYSMLGDVHRYTCNNCGKTFDKKRRLNQFAYCSCSLSPNLRYVGVVTKTYEVASEAK